jgi:hypothetical protein
MKPPWRTLLDNPVPPVTACIIMTQHQDLHSALYMAAQFNPDSIVILSDEITIMNNPYDLDIQVLPTDTAVDLAWRIVPRFPDEPLYRPGEAPGMDTDYLPTEAEESQAKLAYDALMRKLQIATT